MAADEHGKNLQAVGVPLTGNAAIAAGDATFTVPTVAQLAGASYALPSTFQNLGLRAADGSPEWTDETTGDKIQFYEDGYEIDSGQVNVLCKMILAETSPLIIDLKHGVTLSTEGGADLDFRGNPKRYWLYTEDISKNVDGDSIIQRKLAKVGVESVVERKPEKGAVLSYEVTFKAYRDEKLDGKMMRYAQILPTEPAPGP